MIEVGKASTGLKKAVGLWAKKTGLEHNKAKLSGRRSTKMSFKVSLEKLLDGLKKGSSALMG